MKNYIFILYRFQTGGVESVFLNLTNSLPDINFYLVTIKNDINEDLIKQTPNNVSFLHHGFSNITTVNLIKQANQVKRKIKHLEFDDSIYINFSDCLSSLFVTFFLSPFKNRVSWCHCNPLKLKTSKSFVIYKTLLMTCSNVVTICQQQKESLLRMIPALKGKIKVIPNQLNTIDIDNKLTEKKQMFDYKFILMTGRFDNHSKDYATLIHAYSQLDSNIKHKYKLVLMGDGPDLDQFKKLSDNLNEEKNIIFLGNVINPYPWMQRASVFILSSKSEGFSMVVFEAMYCGAPVIASNCEVGPNDLLHNGKYGVLFEVGDVITLRNEMSSILTNIDLQKNFSKLSNLRASQLQKNAIEAKNNFFKKGFL